MIQRFSRFFFIIMFGCFALLASVFEASGQQHLLLLNSHGIPIEDAVIAYQPDAIKTKQKVILTNTFGIAVLPHQQPATIQIFKVGYDIICDTLKANQHKTYTLKPNTKNLADLVVMGQFEEACIDKSVYKIKVINRQRIEQQGAVNLKDILSNELNIRLSQDGILGTQMSMMGVGGQNVKILIDGVPVIGRMDGNIDISQINLNNIERIEVVEGPMSVIYGTDALGGVINLISKQPNKKHYSLNVNTYYENVGTYNFDATSGYQYKKIQITASAGRNFFDGYSAIEGEKIRWKQWKPREQYFAEIGLNYKFKTHNHRLSGRYFNEKITARNNPTITPYAINGFDDYFKTTRINLALYSDIYLKNKATLNLINSYADFGRIKNAYIKNLVTGTEQLLPNKDNQDTTTFNLITFRGTYTTKTQTKLNSQLGYDVNLENGSGKRLVQGDNYIGDFALFYIADIKPSIRLNIRPGIRFIYNTAYGAPIIPSLNLKYDINSEIAIRGSYARGFRAPSLKELNLFFVDVNHNIQGNKNLKAETSNNINLSINYKKQYTNIIVKSELTGFYNTIDNLISLAITDAITQTYSYINIDTYKTFGANFTNEINYKLIKLSLGVSQIARYNQLSKTNNINAYNYAHEYRANFGYTIKKAKTDINVFYKYNGQLPGFAIDEKQQVYQTFIGAFGMMDVSATKSFSKNKIKLTLGVKNLLNVTKIAFNTTSSAHSAGAGNMPMAMGRLLFTSIRINLEKL
ncbi:MAG: TonB-dependent receptor [Bacteroidia bacterium]|nr:TonB-dependent receptor [Bacteroidia bacterium]